MTALGSNAIQARVTAGILVLGLVACDDGRRSRFGLPDGSHSSPGRRCAPGPVSPSPVPTPFGPLVYTPLEIGTVVRGPLMNPPECVGYPLWPCKYFQVTAPESGKLEALLTFSSETQGGQGVDLSVRDAQRALGGLGAVGLADLYAGRGASAGRPDVPHHHVVRVQSPRIRVDDRAEAGVIRTHRHTAMSSSGLRAISGTCASAAG